MDERVGLVTPGRRDDRRAAPHLVLFAIASLAMGCGRKEEAAPAPAPAAVPRVQSGVAYAATAPVREIAVARGASDSFNPVEYWTGQLGSSDPATRQAAAVSLGLAGAAARDAVPSLTDLLEDPNPTTRMLAAQALGRIGPDALSSYTRLEALAADETNVDVRTAATTAMALLRMPLAAPQPAVASTVQVAPTKGVSLTGAGAQELPSVRERIDDPDEGVRVRAMRDAAAFGTVAAPPVDELVRNLRDDSPSVRREAATALGVVGSHSATRAGNVATIGRVLPPPAFGPEAENVITRLGDLLVEDADASVRLAAATALARIGAPAAGAGDDLEKAATHDADEAVRLAATQALTEIRRRY